MHPFFRSLSLVLALAVGFTAACGRADETLGKLGAAPALKLQSLDGRDVSLATLKGKVVVVDFWATWCGPCVGEIPGYVELQKKHGDKLVIVGISLDRGGPKRVREFAEKMKMNYPVVMGTEEMGEAFGGFDAIPTTFLIDREGNIRHRKTGAMEHEEYAKLVEQLL